MINLLLWVIVLLISIFFLAKSADWIADSAVQLTDKLNTTKVALGILLIPILYVLPEFLVTFFATAQGEFNIALGNIIGSNICNIGLMIGLSTMFTEIIIHRRMIIRDGIFMMITTISALALLSDGEISQFDGIVLLSLAVFYTINVYDQERRETPEEKEEERKEVIIELELLSKLTGKALEIKNVYVSFILGISVSLITSETLVRSAVNIASILGVSDLLIGMTVVAVGTSIADIATAIAASRKGYGELAVAGCLGANLFTIMIGLGLTSIIYPLSVSNGMLLFYGGTLLLITSLFFIYMMTKRIGKLKGFTLLFIYAAFLLLSIISEI